MVAVSALVRVHQLKILRHAILIILIARFNMAVLYGCLLYLHPLDPDLAILLLDKGMALLEASRKETDVFKLLLVENFGDATKDFLVKISNIHLILSIIALHGTSPEEITCFIIVLRHVQLV